MAERMFCPRCGKQFESSTSYCRICGLALDGVSEIVSGEAASAPAAKTRPNNKVIRLGVGLFILGTVIAFLNIMSRELGLFPESYGKIVYLPFMVAAVVCMGWAFIFPETYYVKKRRPSQSGGVAALPTGKLDQLPPADRNVDDFISPSTSRQPTSVTEHTTRELN